MDSVVKIKNMNCLELLGQMNRNGMALEDLEKLEEMDVEIVGSKANATTDDIGGDKCIRFGI